MPVQRGTGTAQKRELAPYHRRNVRSTRPKPADVEDECSRGGCECDVKGMVCEGADYHHGIDLGHAKTRRDTRSSDVSDNTAVHCEEPPCHSSETCDQRLPHLQVNAVQEATRFIGNSHIPVDGWFQACRGCSAWTAICLDLEGREIPMCRRCQAKYRRLTSDQGSSASQTSAAVKQAEGPQWMKQMSSHASGKGTLRERQDMCQRALLQLEENWAIFMAKERQKPIGNAQASA